MFWWFSPEFTENKVSSECRRLTSGKKDLRNFKGCKQEKSLSGVTYINSIKKQILEKTILSPLLISTLII